MLLIENCSLLIWISLKLVLWWLTDQYPSQVQIIDGCWTGNKPLPGPMMITDVVWHHQTTMNQDVILSINGILCCGGDQIILQPYIYLPLYLKWDSYSVKISSYWNWSHWLIVHQPLTFLHIGQLGMFFIQIRDPKIFQYSWHTLFPKENLKFFSEEPVSFSAK